MANTYASYKESRIEWIGKTPENWSVTSVGKVYEITLGKMLQPTQIGIQDEIVPYLKAMNVQDGYLKTDKIDEMYASRSEIDHLRILHGDLLVCEGGEVARSVIVQKDLDGMIFQNSLHRVRGRKNYDVNFLHYYLIALRNSGFVDILVNKATISHFTKDKFKSLKIALPNIMEQKEIVKFLNKRTKAIEDLIAYKEKLIEALGEKRQSMITEAVTKGLNPNVKMKDSGVEWIGEIPFDYEVIKLKHLVETKITDGPHETPVLYESGVPFISAEAIKLGSVDFNYMRGYISGEDHKKFSRKCLPRYGDIFMVKSGATTGKIGIVDSHKEFSIWSPLALIRANKEKVLNSFLYYYMQSDIFQKQVQLGWNYGTQQNIGMGVIENLFIICPPMNIQKEILAEIDIEFKNCDQLNEELNMQIQKLKEYRQSLIYEAVTGKIDVCDFEVKA